MWNAIQYVTGGLTLIAFVAAGFFWVFGAYLKQRVEIIRSATEPERVKAIKATEKLFQLQLSDVPLEERAAIAQGKLALYARRQEIQFQYAVILTAVLAVLAALAIWRGDSILSHNSAANPQSNDTSPRPAPAPAPNDLCDPAKHAFC